MSVPNNQNIFSLSVKNALNDEAVIEGMDIADWQNIRSDGSIVGFSAIYNSGSMTKMLFRVKKLDEEVSNFTIKLSWYAISSMRDGISSELFATQVYPTPEGDELIITQDSVNFGDDIIASGHYMISPLAIPSYVCLRITDITEGVQLQCALYV